MKSLFAAVILSAFTAHTVLADPCSPKWVTDESKVGVDGNIRTMTKSADGQVLYAGGEFTTIGGVAAMNVAALQRPNLAAHGARA